MLSDTKAIDVLDVPLGPEPAGQQKKKRKVLKQTSVQVRTYIRGVRDALTWCRVVIWK